MHLYGFSKAKCTPDLLQITSTALASERRGPANQPTPYVPPGCMHCEASRRPFPFPCQSVCPVARAFGRDLPVWAAVPLRKIQDHSIIVVVAVIVIALVVSSLSLLAVSIFPNRNLDTLLRKLPTQIGGLDDAREFFGAENLERLTECGC